MLNIADPILAQPFEFHGIQASSISVISGRMPTLPG